MATLHFLGLITEDGDPTNKLRELAGADESASPAILERIFRNGYAFIFNDGFDLAAATTQQLEEAFREQGLTGDTLRKGTTFFLHGCKATGIEVSRHFAPTRNQSGSPHSAQSKSTSAKKAKRGRKSSPAQVVQTTEDKWLDKFPAFDPSWDKEFRKTWMEAFLTLHPSVAGRTGGDVATGNDDSVDEDDEQEQ